MQFCLQVQVVWNPFREIFRARTKSYENESNKNSLLLKNLEEHNISRGFLLVLKEDYCVDKNPLIWPNELVSPGRRFIESKEDIEASLQQ